MSETNPFASEMAQRCLDRIDPDRKLRDAPDLQPLAHPVIQQQREINGRQPGLDSTDALLQAVLDMAHQVAELRAMVDGLRQDIRGKPNVVMFPANALRHSR